MQIRPTPESVVILENIEIKTEHMEHGRNRCTFQITVKFLKNATWQGDIRWIEENQTGDFSSVLEMLFLMSDALDNGIEEQQMAGWEH